MGQDGVRPGDEGQSEASQDHREGIPGCRYQSAVQMRPRLRGSPRSLKAHTWSFQRSVSRGNPTVRAWKVSMRALGHLRCPFLYMWHPDDLRSGLMAIKENQEQKRSSFIQHLVP